MNLSKFQETVKGREAWHAAVYGVTKSRTRLGGWATSTNSWFTMFQVYSKVIQLYTHTHIHTHIFILFQLNIHFNDFLIFQGIDSCNLFKCSFFSFLEFKLLQFFLIIDNILTNHLPETSIHVSLIRAITTNSWKRNNRLRGMNVSKTQSILLNGSPESSNLRAH